MGRIKSLMIKKAAKHLLRSQPELFTDDFEHNKKLLHNTMPSKSTANKIAGYIKRLVKMQRNEQTKLKAPIEKAVS